MRPTSHELMEYDARKKNLFLAYVLWIFFGVFGAHRAYASGRLGWLAIYTFTTVGLFVAALAGGQSNNNGLTAIGVLGAVGYGILLIIDLFLLPGVLRRYRLALAKSLAPATEATSR